jgi:DNA-binding NarL/FixJ family response regulator
VERASSAEYEEASLMSDQQEEMRRRPFRILIVDDHPVVREGLGIRIGRYSALEVCGEASGVAEALAQIDTNEPDVAIIDISLREGDGLDLIRRIRSRRASIRMLVWSMYPETVFAERALHAGAMGYINKQEATSVVIEAIWSLLEGRLYLSAPMMNRVLERSVAERSPSGGSSLELLSDRELQAFRLIGKGMMTTEIANAMTLSVHTVETYRQRIKSKLKLQTTAKLSQAAVQWVLENG